MDIRKYPPDIKPRRTKGTPTWKFSRNWSIIICTVGLGIGIVQHYLPAGYRYRKRVEEGLFRETEEEKLRGLLFFSSLSQTEKILKRLEYEEHERNRM